MTEHPDRVGEILAELKVKTPASASKPLVAASGMLHTFFNEFLAQNPFVDGKKNEFLLKLGRIARYKGVGEEELARLKTLAVERLAGMGCAAGDIPPRIDSGYRYADMNKGPETPASRAHKAQGSLRRYSDSGEEGEEAEIEKLEADKLRRNVPCLPDELFDRLPDFLKRGLTHVRNKRERDILLLSMITNISGCLPGVRSELWRNGLFRRSLPGGFSRFGQRKGGDATGGNSAAAIQGYYDELNRKDEREYRQKLLKWNLEERLAAQEKRVPDLDQCPEMPVERILKVAPNISKSQLILALEAGGSVAW